MLGLGVTVTVTVLTPPWGTETVVTFSEQLSQFFLLLVDSAGFIVVDEPAGLVVEMLLVLLVESDPFAVLACEDELVTGLMVDTIVDTVGLAVSEDFAELLSCLLLDEDDLAEPLEAVLLVLTLVLGAVAEVGCEDLVELVAGLIVDTIVDTVGFKVSDDLTELLLCLLLDEDDLIELLEEVRLLIFAVELVADLIVDTVVKTVGLAVSDDLTELLLCLPAELLVTGLTGSVGFVELMVEEVLLCLLLDEDGLGCGIVDELEVAGFVDCEDSTELEVDPGLLEVEDSAGLVGAFVLVVDTFGVLVLWGTLVVATFVLDVELLRVPMLSVAGLLELELCNALLLVGLVLDIELFGTLVLDDAGLLELLEAEDFGAVELWAWLLTDDEDLVVVTVDCLLLEEDDGGSTLVLIALLLEVDDDCGALVVIALLPEADEEGGFDPADADELVCALTTELVEPLGTLEVEALAVEERDEGEALLDVEEDSFPLVNVLRLVDNMVEDTAVFETEAVDVVPLPVERRLEVVKSPGKLKLKLVAGLDTGFNAKSTFELMFAPVILLFR